MQNKEVMDKTLELSIQHWNKSFGGISALVICEELLTTNEVVMKAMEDLRDNGKGTIRANIELFSLNLDPETGPMGLTPEPTVTHMFFPCKEILENHFYSSELVREKHPEYQNRLHCGASQLGLVLFSEEVLTRYFDHPELYEVSDSLSGGHILSTGEATDNRYLNVRHGKCKLGSGRTAVTAIYKDLYSMSPDEQRHWHASELTDETLDPDNPDFGRFLARTYDGSWADYKNPIENVKTTLNDINACFGEAKLFKNTDNCHFRSPVENTPKAYYDCCSEFYKLIGPDSIKTRTIKSFLSTKLSCEKPEFIHAESGRALGPLQLLELLEHKLSISGLLTDIIRQVSRERIKADHKVTDPILTNSNLVERFTNECESFSKAGIQFKTKIQEVFNTEQ
jgi:hypothetical protein